MGIDLTREPGCLEKEDRFGSTLSVPTRDGKTAPSHLPAQISRSAEYERILALERKLGNGGNSSALLVSCIVGKLCNTWIGRGLMSNLKTAPSFSIPKALNPDTRISLGLGLPNESH